MNQPVARILIVEDEPKVASFLKAGLEESGYTADVACDSPAGEELLVKEPYDLILLDIMLPGKNGFEICKELRRSGKNTPVLMLTARFSVLPPPVAPETGYGL